MNVRWRLLAVSAIAAVMITAMLMTVASAIPTSDITKFRSVARETVLFDTYTNSSRSISLRTFHRESDSFYFIIRSNPGDAYPYDDFYVNFICSGDALPTGLHTTDYPSWTSAGILSFGRSYYFNESFSYNNASLETRWSACQILSATGLDVNGNAGYTSFEIEMVPVLTNLVFTLDRFCTDQSRSNLTAQLVSGISSVLTNNVDILNVGFVIFETLVVVFILFGIPAVVILIIRWAIWRISGFKLLGKDKNV